MTIGRLCRTAGCRRLISAEQTHCEIHAKLDDERRNTKTRAHGVKRSHFKTLRTQRLELAHDLCELRIDALCTITATSVHIDPALEGDHDNATLDDCRAACAHCHGVVDGARAHTTHGSPPPGRAIFNKSHSPAMGLISAHSRSDGVVIA